MRLLIAALVLVAAPAYGAISNVPQTDPGWIRLRFKPEPSLWHAGTLTGVAHPLYAFATPYFANMFGDQTFADPTSGQFWTNAASFATYQRGRTLSVSVHDLSAEFALGITDLTITKTSTSNNPLTQTLVYTATGETYSRTVVLSRGGVPEPGTFALAIAALGLAVVCRNRRGSNR